MINFLIFPPLPWSAASKKTSNNSAFAKQRHYALSEGIVKVERRSGVKQVLKDDRKDATQEDIEERLLGK